MKVTILSHGVALHAPAAIRRPRAMRPADAHMHTAPDISINGDGDSTAVALGVVFAGGAWVALGMTNAMSVVAGPGGRVAFAVVGLAMHAPDHMPDAPPG